MDVSRLGRGETIAAVSAIALFLIMFLFEWFETGFTTANAWESFGLIDLILLIAIAVAIGSAVATAASQSVNSPVALSAITAGLGILAVLLILFRILSPPDVTVNETVVGVVETSRRLGVFLGLIAAGGIAFGGWQAMQEETAAARAGSRSRARPRARRHDE
jgi:hypothetical protein